MNYNQSTMRMTGSRVMIVKIHVTDMTSCSPFDITKREDLLSSKMLVTVKLHGVTSQKI